MLPPFRLLPARDRARRVRRSSVQPSWARPPPTVLSDRRREPTAARIVDAATKIPLPAAQSGWASSRVGKRWARRAHDRVGDLSRDHRPIQRPAGEPGLPEHRPADPRPDTAPDSRPVAPTAPLRTSGTGTQPGAAS
jgi:hypothetical protein